MLEVYVGVFSHASRHGSVGVEGRLAETVESLAVNERHEVVLAHRLDLLYLVAGAEAVKEVDERHTALDSGEMRHGSKVHDLLHRALAEEGEAGLAGRHDILVVAEDAQCVRGESASRHVEHARQQLAGNLVHVRNHQQQTLRCGVCGCERTGLQRTVNSSGGAGLTLHLLNTHCLAEDVLSPGGRPVIDTLRHG